MKRSQLGIGPRFNSVCKPLVLGSRCFQFVDSVKYLGVCIVASHHFKCSFEDVKLKFFRVFNCIFAKSKAPGSETVSVHLLKSYCLPYLTYACEALPFTKSDIYRLDNLIARSLCRIFNVHTRENIDCLRHYLNVPCLSVVFESRKQRFMDKLIDLDHFIPILRSLY